VPSEHTTPFSPLMTRSGTRALRTPRSSIIDGCPAAWERAPGNPAYGLKDPIQRRQNPACARPQRHIRVLITGLEETP
jgi:hypothetical protein